MGSRGPACHVCAHRECAAINLGLARGVSANALERRYGIGSDSILRHRKNHLPPQLRAKLLAGPDLAIDLDRLKETESQSLLGNLVALRHRLFASFDAAEEAGDLHSAMRVASQLHKNMELVGKLLGDLGVGGASVTNILIQPTYVAMRVELVRALAPFPDARRAVAQVLHALEGQAAEEVEAAANQVFPT